MRVLIIGAGLAGSVASGAFASGNPVNYDKRSDGSNKHKAVMRLRDANVAKYLGVHTEPVTVWKQVAWHGRLYDVADIRMNNLYSFKLYGEYGVRSLSSLGSVDRWLIEGVVKPRHVEYDHTLVRVDDYGSYGIASFKKGNDNNWARIEYDICISTIPMPVMLKAAGIKFEDKFSADPIYVWSADIGYKSSLHQTIYFPDLSTPVYRATVQGQRVIIESMTSDEPADFDDILGWFGIEGGCLQTEPVLHKQDMGKMMTIDENARRQYIYELTAKYNIYSFGRYAIWKPIRADHLVQDIENIKKLARLSGASAAYGHNKSRIGE